MIPLQVHLRRRGDPDKPSAEWLVPVQGSRHSKPAKGGFWTSTYHPGYVSDWVRSLDKHHLSSRALQVPARIAADEEMLTPFSYWLLEVEPSARVYDVNQFSDLAALLSRYPMPEAWRRQEPWELTLDWQALAEDYDGLHLTVTGIHDDELISGWLYGWDCESTVWFRWVFSSVGEEMRYHWPP